MGKHMGKDYTSPPFNPQTITDHPPIHPPTHPAPIQLDAYIVQYYGEGDYYCSFPESCRLDQA